MEDVCEKHWVVKKKPDKKEVDLLSKAINVNPFLATLLIQRGINSFDLAKNYFRPSLAHLHDPFLMKDMEVAVNRLSLAITQKQKILIYGDYDVDGSCSVALVYSFLSSIYSNLLYYIPDRYKEGYGVSKDGIDYAFNEGVSLIISLDCGIRAVEKVAYAKDKGIDFIICDHHLPAAQTPNAIAVLDPKQEECGYPFKELCGCGVGFKLLQAYCQTTKIPFEQLCHYLDYVAIATASDIVPLVDENRAFCALGLAKINNDPLNGIKAIIDVCGFKKTLTISNIVFGIGPRINAAGRLKHAHFAVELLIEQNKEVAEEKAYQINHNNLDRRDLDKQITDEALLMIQNDHEAAQSKSTVLFKKDWHKGIIGIVASRCIERYYKPTIILTASNGNAVGSARSVDGYDVYKAIDACSDILIQFGGHKYAAGLTMDIDKVDEFRKRFEQAVASTITHEQLVQKIKIDIVVSLSYLTERFYLILNQMAPFGPANMTPVFLAKAVKVYGVSRLLKEEHVKFSVKQDDSSLFDCIGFGMKEFFPLLEENALLDICFTLDMNEWQGRRNLQLMLKDIRPHNSAAINVES